MFVNRLSADDKHYVLNRDSLTQPIQMQLCEKQKSFSEFFSAVLKTMLNFIHFKLRNDRHSLLIS